MSPEREKIIQSLKDKLPLLERYSEDSDPEVVSLKRAIRYLSRVSDKRFLSILRSVRGPGQEVDDAFGMMDELTTEMHAEFEIDEESDKELRALSLFERERGGLTITDEKLADYGFTRGQFEDYKDRFIARFGAKK